jgi:hypothetical protein
VFLYVEGNRNGIACYEAEEIFSSMNTVSRGRIKSKQFFPLFSQYSVLKILLKDTVSVSRNRILFKTTVLLQERKMCLLYFHICIGKLHGRVRQSL